MLEPIARASGRSPGHQPDPRSRHAGRHGPKDDRRGRRSHRYQAAVARTDTLANTDFDRHARVQNERGIHAETCEEAIRHAQTAPTHRIVPDPIVADGIDRIDRVEAIVAIGNGGDVARVQTQRIGSALGDCQIARGWVEAGRQLERNARRPGAPNHDVLHDQTAVSAALRTEPQACAPGIPLRNAALSHDDVDERATGAVLDLNAEPPSPGDPRTTGGPVALPAMGPPVGNGRPGPRSKRRWRPGG